MNEVRAPRQQWADVAKGTCIVLVVLWHVTRKDYLALDWDLGAPVTGAWGTASEVLLPVRMPLFFLISGLFSARLLQRSWPEVWRRRVAPMLWLLVVWTLLHTLLFRLTPGFDTAVADDPVGLLVQLTVTPGNLWYLLALGLYVAVARATRDVPHAALAAALVLSAVATAGLVPTPGNRYGLLTNLVWFLLGTRLTSLPAGLRAWVVPTRRVVAATAIGAFAVAAAAWQALGADGWLGVRPALGLLGIAAGAAVAVAVARTRAGSPLAALGRQTLPVYVLHLPLVALAHAVSGELITGATARSLPLAAVYPVVVTALVVGACLALHRMLVRGGASWLFEAPWSRRRVVAVS
ncbi:acyltransferase family protein [Nocardioides sp. C4-1]|uniref:acyltransferase family protein n=1 Tax=Nocardioides sp. C4-1 TaxID=3151851 RepID=UPI003263D51D